MLTTFDADEHVAARRCAAGADGFLLKDTPPPQIVDGDPQGRRRRADAVADGHPLADPAGRAGADRRPARPSRRLDGPDRPRA